MKLRSLLAIGAATAVLGAAMLTSPTSAHAAAYCGQRWGSTPEDVDTLSQATVTGVRAGRHSCYDRLVVDLHGQAAGYHVRYVPQVRSDGAGELVPLRGGARIEVTITSPAYDQDGNLTYRPADPRELVRVGGFRTFRQVAWAGTFEGYTTLGLGVRARLPFRVFILPGPGTGSRVVIDVGHRW
jgi:hypothetical protein